MELILIFQINLIGFTPNHSLVVLSFVQLSERLALLNPIYEHVFLILQSVFHLHLQNNAQRITKMRP